ncbi:MAG: hypothetical protein ABJB01_01785 [Rudaea sp.]
MNSNNVSTFRIPEVWLVLLLLASAVVGSLALVATAVRHPDELKNTPHSIASPLPPSSATHPSDHVTPH